MIEGKLHGDVSKFTIGCGSFGVYKPETVNKSVDSR